ncbi:aldose 1-epimerase family protein [Algoriphagus halophytocola]|uniref:Aldose 1-epimerase family protein n=1 Tax=Algoriphagus halophytocola TaxID=2991499 RepID=A0ABY6MK26_9BACT|nr:aldose 1-epimerase family protein [Algoriphagus sp. TR-M5]UZD23425.1 aldose 1-epimerase family protein [Algoriphagus sp. TR-M5]
MNYSIQSPELVVEINPIGMEISSIRSKSTQREYLWQGDPTFWTGQAPVLFPIIGALKEGYTMISGKKYKIPKHGIVRNSTKPKLIESSEDSLRFRLSWDEKTLLEYPFQFQLDLIFSLSGKSLKVDHEISNLGEIPMPYSLGAHPAFNCPLKAGEKYEEYRIEFPLAETDSTWMVNADGLIGNEQKPLLKDSKIIPLTKTLFDDDALIFKHLNSKKASLSHVEKGAIISVDFEDFTYLGIWAKPNAPFVCIEPWLGIADSYDSDHDFEHKEGIRLLAPGENETKSYTISVEQ